MLIIAGNLVVDPSERDAYVAGCAPVVEAARGAAGCLDFAVTADGLDPSRVCVYELWEDDDSLRAFRGSGPDEDQAVAILSADVRRYGVSSVGDP